MANFINSQNAFYELYNIYNKFNGSGIANISADVEYEIFGIKKGFKNPAVNKNCRVADIELVDDKNGGRIEFLSNEFDKYLYHTGFDARYQDYCVSGFSFIIKGYASSEKSFSKYTITLSNIKELKE